MPPYLILIQIENRGTLVPIGPAHRSLIYPLGLDGPVALLTLIMGGKAINTRSGDDEGGNVHSSFLARYARWRSALD
jgi:hypothetical protein